MTQSRPQQAITGLTPPQVAEARIREEWRTVLGINAGLATLGKRLQQSIVLLPVGWFILLHLFVLKLAPLIGCVRYSLTNRRLMIRKGWKPTLVQEVPLSAIDDVRLDANGVDPFYLAGTLEVVSNGQVVMTLAGCPEPEGFRQAVLNAIVAWVPGRERGPFQPASAVKSEKPSK